MTENNVAAQAGDEPMRLPEFIVRKVEQAIHAATHPTGMHTNGQAMAMVEASQLARLLAVAKSVSPRATEDVERDSRLNKIADAIEADGFPNTAAELREIIATTKPR